MRRRQRKPTRGQPRGGGGGLPRLLPPGWGMPAVAGLLVIAVIAVIGFAVMQASGGGAPTGRGVEEEQDQSPNLPGTWIDPVAKYPDSAQHVSGEVPFCEGGKQEINSEGKATCYASNPPTSGPHSGTSARPGIYDDSNPVPKENFVHNLEHTGVVLLYNCTNCDETVQKLRDIFQGYLKDSRSQALVMTPYKEMEPETIALASWSRLDKFPVSEFDESRVRRFIEVHECRFDPEGFCG